MNLQILLNFYPIVKNVCPNCVNKPIPNIQIKSFMFGVTQLINTVGNKEMIETRGKYLIITKTSSVKESFLTVTYANEVNIAPRNAINTERKFISTFKFDN